MLNRRSLLSATPTIGLASKMETPESTPFPYGQHDFSNLRDASMYYRSCRYDVALELDGPIYALHSWACGFLAHPASRSTYRQYPNLFEDGPVEFLMPGLPGMGGELIERSESIFGEDATLIALTGLDAPDASGAMAICLNGALVQMVCLEPADDLNPADAESTVRALAESIQARDRDFYGRGELNREVVFRHVALPEDIKYVFPRLRLREDTYMFKQDDGISDFWE